MQPDQTGARQLSGHPFWAVSFQHHPFWSSGGTWDLSKDDGWPNLWPELLCSSLHRQLIIRLIITSTHEHVGYMCVKLERLGEAGLMLISEVAVCNDQLCLFGSCSIYMLVLFTQNSQR